MVDINKDISHHTVVSSKQTHHTTCLLYFQCPRLINSRRLYRLLPLTFDLRTVSLLIVFTLAHLCNVSFIHALHHVLQRIIVNSSEYWKSPIYMYRSFGAILPVCDHTLMKRYSHTYWTQTHYRSCWEEWFLNV